MVVILGRLDVKKSLSVGKWLFLFLKTKGEKKMEDELRLVIKLYEDKIVFGLSLLGIITLIIIISSI